MKSTQIAIIAGHGDSPLAAEVQVQVDAADRLGATVEHFDLRDVMAVEPPRWRIAAPACFLLAASERDAELEAVIPWLLARHPDVPQILVTRCANEESVLHLLGLGLEDFIQTPLQRHDLVPRILRVVRRAASTDPVVRRLKERLGLQQLVGESAQFVRAIEQIPIMARCDATVLIEGETGTGKDVCARAVHYMSARSSSPFVAVNGGAIPVELVENELFGHDRAAFTGASSDHDGLIRAAEGGTLFLDEIDCLPASAQVKLMRVLQECEYRPLGSTVTRRADVRFLAATNTDIAAAVRTGRLRADLYYRLNVLRLRLPPLRERGADVVPLARHFASRFAAELGRRVPDFSTEAVRVLLAHHWPGNVRELQHVIERAVIMLPQQFRAIRPEDLSLDGETEEIASFNEAKRRVVQGFERRYLEGMLASHDGNITRAAAAAQKNRRAFFELMRKHDIQADRFKESGHEFDLRDGVRRRRSPSNQRR